MKARRTSVCGACGALVRVGQRIVRVTEDGRARWIHRSCWLDRIGLTRSVEDIFLPGDRPPR